MSFDTYKARLKEAAWDWLEAKFCRFHKSLRKKDRASGRNEKRSARQEDRREIEKERP